jgi:hypothetical protein
MKRARFTEQQIIGVLREHEAGAKTADLTACNRLPTRTSSADRTLRYPRQTA